MIGVITFACQTRESVGHAAGLAWNVAAGHAFCSVVRREGSCLGRSTLTDLKLACVPSELEGNVSFTDRLAPCTREVLPDVDTLIVGVNFKLEQFAASNGVATLTVCWLVGTA